MIFPFCQCWKIDKKNIKVLGEIKVVKFGIIQ